MDATAPRRVLDRMRPVHWIGLDCAVAALIGLPVFATLVNLANGPFGAALVPIGVAAFTVPVAVRRDHPVLALCLLLAGLALVGLVEPRAIATGLLSLALVLYTAAAVTRPRTGFMALACALAAGLATALPDFEHRGAATLFVVLYLVSWMLGYSVGMHRRHTQESLDFHARIAATELQQARQDLMQERVRIARELHDIVAHGMSVITVQAGYGTLVIDSEPEAAREALGAIEVTGRQTLAEMRRLLCVLRQEAPADDGGAPALSPSPGMDDLGGLVDETARAGVRVVLTSAGLPQQPIPAGVGLSAYRIVQEALTNTVKHANASSAWVHVGYEDGNLVVDVRDDGDQADGAPTTPGHGLVGMRERARLCGGLMYAGPRVGGGFQVTCRLPLASGSAGGAPASKVDLPT